MSAANDLEFETSFWGNCCNTHEEESKHFVYAKLMGLTWVGSGQRLDGYGWNAGGKRVLDIGGGPVSMLLRTVGLGEGSVVVDPIAFPDWVYARYQSRSILKIDSTGEDMTEDFTKIYFNEQPKFDECWIYNVLQHTIDPELVIANARRAAPVLRMFEWIDIPAYEGHPHMLTTAKLDAWTGGRGYVTELRGENGCWGKCWSGVF